MVSVMSWNKEVFSGRLSYPPSIIYALKVMRRSFNLPDNQYLKYQKLTEIDPVLYGSIHTLAALISDAFKGISVRFGEVIEEEERELVIQANRIIKEYDLKGLIYRIAFGLLRDGDVVLRKDSLEFLPLANLTIIPDRSYLNNFSSEVITKRGLYVLNEGSESQEILKPEEVIHFSLNPEVYVYDNKGRLTYGVWSVSPIKPIISTVLWKMSLIENDMLWRYRLIPREHHRLSSEAFKPEYYAGKNAEEKIQNAISAANQAISDYKEKIRKVKADESYITLDNVEISILEPKSSYSSPNEFIDQLNGNIAAAVGMPMAIFTGQSKGSYSSFLALISLVIARARYLVSLMKPELFKWLMSRLPDKLKPLSNKLDIVFDLVLEKDKIDIARQIAILRESGLFTFDELRALWGAPTISPEKLPEATVHKRTETPREIASRPVKSKEPQYNITPESRRDKQIT